MTAEVRGGEQSSQKHLVLENEIKKPLTRDQPMGNVRHCKSKTHVLKVELGLAILI